MKRITSITVAALAFGFVASAEAATYSDGVLTVGGVSYPLNLNLYNSVVGALLGTQSCGNGIAPADTNALKKAGDPLVLTTANEVRQVVDLDSWSPVGLKPLQWTRWANSRLPWTWVTPFGFTHNWRHGYQWQLVIAYTATGSVATIHEPQGTRHVLAESAQMGQSWNPITYADTLRLVEDEDGFLLTLNDGTRVRFEFESGTSTGETWRPSEILDAEGNPTTLSYNTSGRLIQLADAAGHSLSLTWTNLPLYCNAMGTLKTITTAPPAGQWVEILLTNAPQSRYIRFYSADGAFARIADMEVYVNGSATPSAGTSFGGPPTDSSHALDMALDGNSSTYYEAAATNGGFVGIDIGANAQPTKIRYRAASGYEAGMVNGKFEQLATATYSLGACVSLVTASDGRQVRYEYTQMNDTAIPYVWEMLTAVHYGDGTSAELGYAQVAPGTRPLVHRWREPRHAGPPLDVEYFDTKLGTLGQVRKQSTTNGCVIGIVTIKSSIHQPMLLEPTGSDVVEEMNWATGRSYRDFDGFGRKTEYGRDSRTFVTNVTDALNRQTSYTRTSIGNEMSVRHPNGRTVTWTRDDLELPLTRIESGPDIVSRTNIWTRDSLHRVTRIDHPNGAYETFSYNSLGQVLTHRLPTGGTESFEYDTAGRRTLKTDAVGGEWTYTYNAPSGTNDFAANLVDAVTDPRGNTTQFFYTERGLLCRVVWADSSQRSLVYDAYGNLIRETDELGKATAHAYNALKLRIATTNALGQVTQIHYRPDCYQEKPLDITLPSGKKVAFEYDAAWRLTKRIEAPGTSEEAETLFAYDLADNLTTNTEPGGGVWKMLYNLDDRMVSATDPLGHTVSNIYDCAGNLLRQIRPDGTVWTNTYNSMDWKTTSIDPLGRTTRFVYNDIGNLTSLTDAVGRAHSFGHDDLGRRTSMTFPDSSTEQYRFDSAGNLTGMVNRAGTRLLMEYDNRNRLTDRIWADGTAGAEIAYDAAGRVVSIVNSNSALGYTYDDAGRLLTETQDLAGQPQALTVSYTPDADGRPSTLGYPSGLDVAYAYGARGLLSTVSAGGSTLAAISRNANGLRTAMTLVNGTSTAYSFDAASRITGIDHATIGGPFATRDYIYNSLDLPTNMVSGISGVGNVTDDYSHDPLDQLVRARYALSGGTPVRDVQYSFDAVGNRTAVDDTGTNTSYTVNSMNQYTAIGGDSLTYDGNGNLATGAGLTLGYDAQGRLISAATATNAVSFIYDGRNRCVARTTVTATTGSTVWFVWGHEQSSHWGLLEERDADGDLIARYVHGEGIDEILRREAGASTVFYHHDALGSTIALTDASGALVEQYRYDIYGPPIVLDASGAPSTPDPRTSPLGNRFMFTGREWLSDLGLYDYRNRAYSPLLGRWLQPDSVGFMAGDVNLYRYCSNRSASLTDPTGHFGVFGAVAGAITGAISGAVAGISAGLASGGGWQAAAAAGLAGAAGGALAGAAVGLVNVALASSAGGAVGGLVGGAVAGAVAGAVGGALGGALGSATAQFSETGTVKAAEVGRAAVAGAIVGAAAGAISGVAAASLGLAGQLTGLAEVAAFASDLVTAPAAGILEYTLQGYLNSWLMAGSSSSSFALSRSVALMPDASGRFSISK